jgi:hypothetical protein
VKEEAEVDSGCVVSASDPGKGRNECRRRIGRCRALSSEVGSVRREAPSRVMLCRNVV